MNVTWKSTLTIGLLVTACGAACGSGAQSEKTDAGAISGSGGGATGGAAGTGAPGTGGSMGTGGVSDAGIERAGTGGTQDAGAVSDGTAVDATPPTPGTDAAQGPCTTNSLRPGTTTIMIQHGGLARDYVLHVPAGYTGTTRVPVVVDMHGAGGTAAAAAMGSAWVQKSDQAGFIVIFPQGQGNVWNAGTCCAPTGAPPLQTSTADDTGFIRAAVTKTAQDGCIDLNRVYAVGLSNGGLMSYRLACVAADMFAGIAPASGASVTTPCNPSRPVTVVAFRGTMDDLVPYNGGMPRNHLFPSAKADFELWAMLDKCTGTPTASRGVCQTYSQCAGGVEVTLCTIVGGHVLYGAAVAAGVPVPDVAWEIFQRHAMP